MLRVLVMYNFGSATTKQVDLPGNNCEDPSIELPAARCRLVRSLHFSILIDSGKKLSGKKGTNGTT